MAFPNGWISGQGMPVPSGRRSLRFFVSAVASAAFADNAYNFSAPAGSLVIPAAPRVNPGQEVSSGASPTPVVSTPMGGQLVPPAAQAVPVAAQAAWGISVTNDGTGDLEFSFDGTHIHGYLKAGETRTYLQRLESGIAVRGASGATPTFRVEAW